MPQYPERKLGFQNAVSDPQDAWNDQVLAVIALANLHPGDQLPGIGTVLAIGRTVTFLTASGKRRFSPGHRGWGQLVRNVGSLITAAQHGVPAGDLHAALGRDPAFRFVSGLPCVSDHFAKPHTEEHPK